MADHSIASAFRAALAPRQKALHTVAENRGGWWPRIMEAFTGAWQQNVEVQLDSVLSYHAVFSCMSLIASDIAKLRIKLVRLEASGVWVEYSNPAYSPVLRKPNNYQNRIQFVENWVLSKLMRGNTYVLKVRDARGVVRQLHVLDPNRVKPLVTESGDVYYEVQPDTLTGSQESITIPAREIIHDRFNCLFHPLVGTSPIFANGLAATQGLRIQNNSATFFGNASMPGGILTAPGELSDETAAELKATWAANYSGKNAGKIAVVGDGLKFEAIAQKAVDAQLLEQLKWTAEVVCSTFHVPPYKVGIGAMPTYNNIQALNVEYYSQCLQSLIEAMELCLDEGLEMNDKIGTELDLENLLRMDSGAQIAAIKDAAGIIAPNEGRKRLGLEPKPGGDSPYLQQQNYSLEALAKRDAQENPWAASAPPQADPKPDSEGDKAMEVFQAQALLEIAKGLAA